MAFQGAKWHKVVLHSDHSGQQTAWLIVATCPGIDILLKVSIAIPDGTVNSLTKVLTGNNYEQLDRVPTIRPRGDILSN